MIMAAAAEAATASDGTDWSAIIPIAIALVPWVGAWALKRFRSPSDARDIELARLAAERDKARGELREDNSELRARIDVLEARLTLLESENLRLRGVEFRQSRRIDLLERALREANIPIPPGWTHGPSDSM